MRLYRSIALFVALGAGYACAQQVTAPTTPAPSDAPRLYRVGSGVTAPTILHAVPAKFSEEASAEKFTGVCLVTLIVDAHGMPQGARVVRKLGHGLDEQALAAINHYQFNPAMFEGRPVPVRITMQVEFKLYSTPGQNPY
jgi:TonB family protein